jgi:hypothetical protein
MLDPFDMTDGARAVLVALACGAGWLGVVAARRRLGAAPITLRDVVWAAILILILRALHFP